MIHLFSKKPEMPFNEYLVERITRILDEKKVNYTDKKMFGGLCFLINNKMLAGIVKENLMARIGKDFYDEALTKKGVLKMDFTGKEMKGYVFVTPESIDLDSDLEYWIDLCLIFNQQL